MDVWAGLDISACPNWYCGPRFQSKIRWFGPWSEVLVRVFRTNHGPTNILDHRSDQTRSAKIFKLRIDHGLDYYHPRPWNPDLLFWLLISKGPSLRLISSGSSLEVDLFCFQLLEVAPQLELQLLDWARQSLTVQYRYVELEDRKLKTAALKAANGSYPEEWIRIRFLKIIFNYQGFTPWTSRTAW